jgi:hypothetical protein
MPAAVVTAELIALLEFTDRSHARAKRALETSEAEREQVRARLRRRLAAGEWVEVPEAGKRILRNVNKGGRTFSLTAYERAHGPLTPEMTSIVSRAKGAEVWTIEDLD